MFKPQGNYKNNDDTMGAFLESADDAVGRFGGTYRIHLTTGVVEHDDSPEDTEGLDTPDYTATFPNLDHEVWADNYDWHMKQAGFSDGIVLVKSVPSRSMSEYPGPDSPPKECQRFQESTPWSIQIKRIW